MGLSVAVAAVSHSMPASTTFGVEQEARRGAGRGRGRGPGRGQRGRGHQVEGRHANSPALKDASEMTECPPHQGLGCEGRGGPGGVGGGIRMRISMEL